jgi:endonuclease/exonuclease/phosphatase family metal-dependent hydrolase
LTDNDVILARTDLPPGAFTISNARSANFADAVSFLGTSVPRGWASVDVQYGDLEFRLVSTHLENEPTVQVAQGNALLAPGGPTDTPLDVVLIGDFNSPADGTGTPTYSSLLAGGFADAWTQTHGDAPGYTWGQDADLLNANDTFTERIDLVLLGGGLTASSVDIIGEEPSDRTPGGLWPSDHAGVVATIVPEPGTMAMALLGVAGLLVRRAYGR